MIGKTILHYRILEKLGEGGMGVVYKAQDTKLDRTVAIKFLPRQLATVIEETKRFEREAKAAAVLNHPNIATIFAIEELEDDQRGRECFIVMEYIDGQELREKIKTSPLSMEEILKITSKDQPHNDDYEHMNRSRARLIEWIMLEDYGIKVARENGITMEMIEAYSFPPAVRY